MRYREPRGGEREVKIVGGVEKATWAPGQWSTLSSPRGLAIRLFQPQMPNYDCADSDFLVVAHG
jgi:hypothetical protein